MTELAKLRPGVKNYQVAVSESGGDIVFLRRVVPGNASKSYGIEVARLAGLPQPVVERAREILTNLEQNELDVTGKPKFARHLKKPANTLTRCPYWIGLNLSLPNPSHSKTSICCLKAIISFAGNSSLQATYPFSIAVPLRFLLTHNCDSKAK
jgi:hypothetical protein